MQIIKWLTGQFKHHGEKGQILGWTLVNADSYTRSKFKWFLKYLWVHLNLPLSIPERIYPITGAKRRFKDSEEGSAGRVLQRFPTFNYLNFLIKKTRPQQARETCLQSQWIRGKAIAISCKFQTSGIFLSHGHHGWQSTCFHLRCQKTFSQICRLSRFVHVEFR